MKTKSLALLVAALAAAFFFLFGRPADSSPTAQTPPGVVVDTAVTYQTWHRWEATSQSGRNDVPAGTWALYGPTLMDQAVALGINGLRIEIHNQWHDPGTGQTDWSNLDATIENEVALFCARLPDCWLTLCPVDFGAQGSLSHDPRAYAAWVQEAWLRIEAAGYAVDGVEVTLEPDSAGWDNTTLRRATSELAALVGERDLIAPSSSKLANARNHAVALSQQPITATQVAEGSFHGYDNPQPTPWAKFVSIAGQFGWRLAMLERGGATYTRLHADIERGVSAWQQYTLAFPQNDNGYQLWTVDATNPSAPALTEGSRTKLLRRYMQYIRPWAVRVGASSALTSTAPLAFVNANGGVVVVLKTTAPGAVTVSGLPAGTYGVSYAVDGGVDGEAADIQAAGLVEVWAPGAGVVTLHQRVAVPTGTPAPTDAAPTATPLLPTGTPSPTPGCETVYIVVTATPSPCGGE